MKKILNVLACIVLVLVVIALRLILWPLDLLEKRHFYTCQKCGKRSDRDKVYQNRSHWDCPNCNKTNPIERLRECSKGKVRAMTEEEEMELKKQIATYPVKQMTQSEFDSLPQAVDLDFRKACPIGTWFPCRSRTKLRVVGQIVLGDDLCADQWGGLTVPERGVNRYRLEIVG